jgi:hypothetical protein
MSACGLRLLRYRFEHKEHWHLVLEFNCAHVTMKQLAHVQFVGNSTWQLGRLAVRIPLTIVTSLPPQFRTAFYLDYPRYDVERST